MFKAFSWFFYTNRSLGFCGSQALTFYVYSDLIVKNTVWFQLKHVENGNKVQLIDVQKSAEGSY
jgi:hypothetical protein